MNIQSYSTFTASVFLESVNKMGLNNEILHILVIKCTRTFKENASFVCTSTSTVPVYLPQDSISLFNKTNLEKCLKLAVWQNLEGDLSSWRDSEFGK